MPKYFTPTSRVNLSRPHSQQHLNFYFIILFPISTNIPKNIEISRSHFQLCEGTRL